jgi:hypothetical protein
MQAIEQRTQSQQMIPLASAALYRLMPNGYLLFTEL